MSKCPTCGQTIRDNKTATFESSQRRVKSAALAIPEMAGSTNNIHHHGTAWASIILSAFACALILLPVGWWIGVFLLDRAGYKKPEESLANGVLILAVVLPSLLLVSWILERVPRVIIRELAEWRLQEKEIDLQAIKLQVLAGQSSVPTASNLTEADVRFVRVVKQVIGKVYLDRIGKDKLYVPYKPKEPRPWSRDVCKETVLMWDNKKVGWTDANRLGKYIIDHEIIIDSQLNQGRYPTMDAVNDLLESNFARPILVSNPSPTVNGKGQ